MKDQENIDKHLKRSLEDFSVQPRITSFDAVLQKLEKKKRRRILIWWFFPGIITLGGALTFFMLSISGESIYSDIAEKNGNIKTREIRSKTLEKDHAHGVVPGSLVPASSQKNDHFPKREKTSSTNKNYKTKQKNNVIPTKANEPQSFVNYSAPGDTQMTVKETEIKAKPDLTIIADHLDPFQLFLPFEENNAEGIKFSKESTFITITDSLADKKIKQNRKFLFGFNFDPQLSTNQFSENKRSNVAYGDDFAKLYLESRKNHNTIKFDYSLGVKTGLMIRNKWEVLLGFGFQRFKSTEKIYFLNAPILNSSNPSTNNYSAAFDSRAPASANQSYNNTFRYLYYSLEASKYVSFGRFVKMKTGLGFQVNQLLSAQSIVVAASSEYYYYSKTRYAPLNKWMYTVNLKLGFIHDLNQRTQFQFCPAFFYAPNSMFTKDYVIKQRAFGLKLECLLLFKLGK